MTDDYAEIFGSGFNNPQWGRVTSTFLDIYASLASIGIVIDESKVTIISIEANEPARTVNIHAGGPDAQAEWLRIQPLLGGWVGRAFGVTNKTKENSKVQTGRDRNNP